jgi:8-oxo-dGTP pyrophosphatase MutT (NUDIX family)
MEAGETEMMTALREIREETGLQVFLREGFREAVEYSPKPNVKKQVIYFIGFTLNENVLHPQEEEVSEVAWMEIHTAYEMVTFRNDKNLISRAMEYLERRGI